MIRYVAFMKLKDETPPNKLSEIERQLRVLGESVGEVCGWSSGRCLGSPESSAAWTFIIVADFLNEQDFQRYREHPQHQAFRELIAPYREKVANMHYPANYPGLFWIMHEGGVPIPLPPHGEPPMGYRYLPPLEG